MPILFFHTTKTEIYPVFIVNLLIILTNELFLGFIGIFYPSGEAISKISTFNARVGWVGPFAVYKYSCMNHAFTSHSARGGGGPRPVNNPD
jgi:hypothetical protein